MIKYTIKGELNIEAIDENDRLNQQKFIIPLLASGLNYNMNQFINKKSLLEQAIKQIMEKE